MDLNDAGLAGRHSCSWPVQPGATRPGRRPRPWTGDAVPVQATLLEDHASFRAQMAVSSARSRQLNLMGGGEKDVARKGWKTGGKKSIEERARVRKRAAATKMAIGAADAAAASRVPRYMAHTVVPRFSKFSESDIASRTFHQIETRGSCDYNLACGQGRIFRAENSDVWRPQPHWLSFHALDPVATILYRWPRSSGCNIVFRNFEIHFGSRKSYWLLQNNVASDNQMIVTSVK